MINFTEVLEASAVYAEKRGKGATHVYLSPVAFKELVAEWERKFPYRFMPREIFGMKVVICSPMPDAREMFVTG